MKHTIVCDLIKDQIFNAVCQRAANGHNDLMKTARELLDVTDELFSEEEIQLKQRKLTFRCPPPPTKPVPPISSSRDDL